MLRKCFVFCQFAVFLVVRDFIENYKNLIVGGSFFQEFLSLTVVRHEALHFCPECGGVVMVADMRKLVYNDIVNGCVRVEHKAARKADGILAGARAEARLCPGDGDSCGCNAHDSRIIFNLLRKNLLCRFNQLVFFLGGRLVNILIARAHSCYRFSYPIGMALDSVANSPCACAVRHTDDDREVAFYLNRKCFSA